MAAPTSSIAKQGHRKLPGSASPLQGHARFGEPSTGLPPLRHEREAMKKMMDAMGGSLSPAAMPSAPPAVSDAKMSIAHHKESIANDTRHIVDHKASIKSHKAMMKTRKSQLRRRTK